MFKRQFMKNLLLLLTLLLSLQADNFEKGLAAYDNEDFNTAVTYWIPLAKAGNIDAQTSMAMMYEDGDGVAQSSEKALYWYQKAATQGNIDSQLILAMSYCHGDGVDKDLNNCAKWAKMAKDSGENVAILWNEFELAKYQ